MLSLLVFLLAISLLLFANAHFGYIVPAYTGVFTDALHWLGSVLGVMNHYVDVTTFLELATAAIGIEAILTLLKLAFFLVAHLP